MQPPKNKRRSKEQKTVKEAPLPERVIQTAILEYLRQRPDLEVWRMPNGAVRHSGVMKKSPVAGFPDLFGCLAPQGRLFAFEIKAKDGRVSDVQKATLERLANVGAVVAIVRSLQDVIDILREVQDAS